MMMTSRAVVLGIVLLSFAVGVYSYPLMSDRFASHWNIRGEVDGYTSKLWGLFLLPFIQVGLALLLVGVPHIDPLRENIEKFRKHYERFMVTLLAFMFYVYLLTIFWNAEVRFDLMQLLTPAFAALFYHAGVLTENAKRNWFIGIRTPWTLSSERVWEKTHRIGGRMFKTCGLVTLLGVLPPSYAFLLILAPLFILTGYTVAYSYFEYQRETTQ